MTLKEVLREATESLFQAGADAPRLSARILACRALGCSRLDLELLADDEVLPRDQAEFATLLKRRIQGEPTARILGEREFYGRMFLVSEATLVPRPETELLVEIALARLPAAKLVFADLGAGTGCVGVSLCAERPQWLAAAADISAPALRVAADNAARHGVKERILFVRGDYCAPMFQPASPDCIVSNPPYVSEAEYRTLSREVRDFDPRLALVPGSSGLEHIQALAVRAAEALRPGGLLLMEFGTEQGEAVEKLFGERPDWMEVRIHRDLAGLNRCLEARRSGRR
ncbi:MAG: peptide chain release factor N(5)-glutamine methyltransferase [Deltaproteobacteria bacterium]|jgi:release factor glutamine methyltransferase|nr:peptide chain release factor N(5)-glutamine methyltransferase [Deltaproteobacteria bacterium]